jgi:hypothetical protein
MIQTTVTREQVKELLRTRHNLETQLIEDRSVPVYGVNIYAKPSDRHCYTTIWWPDDRPNMGDFVWGPHFEHHAPADISVELLADAIAATIPTKD